MKTETAHPRLRDRLRDEVGTVILRAAEEVIAEEGLLAARIERIAVRAGVSVGTIYNHFKDRMTLVQALFDARGERLRASLEEALARSAAQPVEAQVRALLDVVVTHGRDHARLVGAMMEENHGPMRLHAPSLSRAVMAEHCATLVRRGIASGELRDDPQGVFAVALTALAQQVLTLSAEGRGSAAEIETISNLFVRGAAHRAPSR